jgi:hypothetical protein
MPSVDKNRDYYRDTAVYLKKTMETSRLDFTVQNAGNVLARDVRIELNIPDPDRTLVFRDADDMPDEPSTSFLLSRVTQPVLNPDINVQRAPDAHVITAQLGKIQAKA